MPHPEASATSQGDDGSPEFLDMPAEAKYSVRYPMALAFAASQHAAQSRKDDQQSPYIVHLLAVSQQVILHGWGDPRLAAEIEDLAIAGLLHDLAEDHGGQAKLAEIEAMFGPRVSEVVRNASDSLVADAAAKSPWRERKEDHIARVRALAAPGLDGGPTDPGSCLVIACDKLDNLSATVAGVERFGEGYLERFRGGADGTHWYYRTMAAALAPALAPDLATELSDQVDRLPG